MKEKKVLTEKDGGRYSMKGSRWWGVLLFLVLVLIDQLTKLVADAYMDKGDFYWIIKDWIGLTITYNRGISYGMGADTSPMVKLAVIAGTLVMMAVIALLYFKLDKRRSWLRVAFVFIVAGGIGNFIDRVYYQVWNPDTVLGVRDMVDLSRFGFAVCNFADFFISAGAVMLVFAFLFFDKDAFFPVGKYKLLAKEYEEKEEAKKQAKAKQASGENTQEEKNG